jgi:hypothetical protein
LTDGQTGPDNRGSHHADPHDDARTHDALPLFQVIKTRGLNASIPAIMVGSQNAGKEIGVGRIPGNQ